MFNLHRLGTVLGIFNDIVAADADDAESLVRVFLRELSQLGPHVNDERAVVAHEDDQQSGLPLEIGQRHRLAVHIGERKIGCGAAQG